MLKSRYILVALVLLASSQFMLAQQPVTKSQTVKATATIVAIDSTNRTVVLRTANGEEDSYSLGPDAKRFGELKVGDKVNISFVESLVVTAQRPGATTKPSTAAAAVTPGSGKSPGGTISGQLTTTVTVKAVDPAVPSITVTTADGRTVTRKIENKKNLEGIKAGDKLDLTYTQAVLVNVEHSKQ
jgi:Cu/Ag efflux protein CusF